MSSVADPSSPWDRALSEFADRGPGVYLDTAARGLLPRSVMAAVVHHLESRVAGSTDKAALFETVERVRSRFAALVGCGADEVAFTKNISEGISLIAAALPWQEGDNVVLCTGLEHPSNVFPWLNLRARHEIEIRDVPSPDGHLPVEAMAAAADGRTRVITFSTVTFAPGLASDVTPLVEAARAHGAFLLADGAQSVGVLHTDVRRLGVDGLAASTQKGLLGLYGMGFLYCRREWAERLSPAALSRFGVDLGGAHEADMGTGTWRLAAGARRFDIGNYNYPAVVAAERALDLLHGVGTEAIDSHVRALARRAAQGLADLGLPVFGHAAAAPPDGLAGIVTIGPWGQGAHDTPGDAAVAALAQALADASVRFSLRRGLLRLSFHLYNTADDVDRVLSLARRLTTGAVRRVSG